MSTEERRSVDKIQNMLAQWSYYTGGAVICVSVEDLKNVVTVVAELEKALARTNLKLTEAGRSIARIIEHQADADER